MTSNEKMKENHRKAEADAFRHAALVGEVLEAAQGVVADAGTAHDGVVLVSTDAMGELVLALDALQEAKHE